MNTICYCSDLQGVRCQVCRTPRTIICEDCPRPATTLVEIHDAAAPTTQQTWHEAPKCDGHRDELVEQIANGDDDVRELTIEHMTSLLDADVLACERG